MRKGCGITTSFATAAAMLRTWSGTTCPGLPRAPSVSGFFANANSFSGGSARSAHRGALPVRCRRARGCRVNGARQQAWPAAIARMESQDGVAVRRDIFFTHSKGNQQMEKELTATAAAVPNNPTEAKCPVKVGARRNTVAGAPTNAGWWPDQLNLKILHQTSPLSDPMGKAFNYAEEFKSLDLKAVIKDLHALMTDSQD